MTLCRTTLVPCIQCEHLAKGFTIHRKRLDILLDVSFSLYTGESVALRGRSGAGKSTVLGLVAGLDRPDRGAIHFQGLPFERLSEQARCAWRAKHLGFVFQEPKLLGHLTALENVMLPLELRQDPQAGTRARLCLEQVGLLDRASHYPSELSGGEQQRVSMARALVKEPTLLLMDEPTAHLDPETATHFMDVLFQIKAYSDRSPTLLCVTHDASVQARCDRILHLEAGRLVS